MGRRSKSSLLLHRPRERWAPTTLSLGSLRLDFALFTSHVNVDQGEGGSLGRISGIDGDYVLVVFGTDFQFRDGARIVVITLQFFVPAAFRIFLVVFVHIHVAAMLIGVAFQDLAVSLQLVAVEIED